jgi:two-component system NarL family sensor kinase
MHRPPRSVSTGLALAQFAAAGLIALVVLALLGLNALRSSTEHEAVVAAAELTSMEAEVVIEPLLTDKLLDGDPSAVSALDLAVRDRVLSRRVVRVKLWSAQGQVVYSDDARLVGRVFPLDPEDKDTLRTGEVNADVSDLSAAENKFEHFPSGDKRLLQVYTRVHTRGGTPLLFEMYLPSHRIEVTARHIGRSVIPAFLPALLALEILQLPLAWRLVRRIKQGQREREAMYQYTLEARDQERQRIARDLHDGVVQSLAGVSFSLTAVGERLSVGKPEGCEAQVRSAARTTRGNLKELRTLIADIYPPTLHEVGLQAAVEELLDEVAAAGVAVELHAPKVLDLPDELAGAIYRGAREALRNVAAHSCAQSVEVRLEQDSKRIRLVVRDDGVGLSARPPAPDAHHHFGLRLLSEMAQKAGGRLALSAHPDGGTVFLLELPTS